MRERRCARWCGRGRRFHIGCVFVGGCAPTKKTKKRK
jgi:hypothetical protein